jgi:hypothetical protein
MEGTTGRVGAGPILVGDDIVSGHTNDAAILRMKRQSYNLSLSTGLLVYGGAELFSVEACIVETN